MMKSENKKVAKTRYCGECRCGGGRWSEFVATKKQANKKYRKMWKLILNKIDY